MSKFLKINTYPDLPGYLNKSFIIAVYMISDVSDSLKPYIIWINTSQTCMSERFVTYEKALKRLTEILFQLED
jgi:hypothetical protein